MGYSRFSPYRQHLLASGPAGLPLPATTYTRPYRDSSQASAYNVPIQRSSSMRSCGGLGWAGERLRAASTYSVQTEARRRTANLPRACWAAFTWRRGRRERGPAARPGQRAPAAAAAGGAGRAAASSSHASATESPDHPSPGVSRRGGRKQAAEWAWMPVLLPSFRREAGRREGRRLASAALIC